MKHGVNTTDAQRRWSSTAHSIANAFDLDALWLIRVSEAGRLLASLATSHAAPAAPIPDAIRAFVNAEKIGPLIIRERLTRSGSYALADLIEAAVQIDGLLIVGGKKIGFGYAAMLRSPGTEVTIRDAMKVITSTLDPNQIDDNPPGYRTKEVPLKYSNDSNRELTIAVHVSEVQFKAQQKSLLTSIAWVSGIAGLLAFLLGALIARRISAPVQMLADATRQIAKGSRDLELPEGRNDEIGELVSAFKDMTSQLGESERRLRRVERVAAWQEIARELAHEIKNPLTSIQMSIENVRRVRGRHDERFEEVFEESTRTVMDEVQRLKGLVTEFSEFARLPKPNPEPTQLNDVVHQAVVLYRDNSEGVVLVENLDDSLVEQALDPERMTQVIQNLIKNAIQSTTVVDRPGRVEVTTESSGDGFVQLIIKDNGCGIAKDDIDTERIFVPYFTNKSGGTGLGLAVVHRIVAGRQQFNKPQPNLILFHHSYL
ncbi:MAG TPA: HAMP domain-containing sensor histidine kinase [Myxococcales bacterium]|nr:HAMP domain-containing sensor histidine kinase [Myxococcales bacterium]